MLLGLNTYSFYLYGVGMEIPLADRQQALRIEEETIECNIRSYREVLGIKKKIRKGVNHDL